MDGDDSDFEFLDLRPRSWADAFPGSPARQADQVWEQGKWWDWSIDDTDTAARNSVVGNIVSLAIDRLGKWTIGDVFPGLPSEVELAKLDLPVRAKNVLYREQILTGADIAELPVEDLLAFRNAGVGTVTAILRELVEVSTFQAQATLFGAAAAGDDRSCRRAQSMAWRSCCRTWKRWPTGTTASGTATAESLLSCRSVRRSR